MFEGALHLLPKFSMFCALSPNNQHLFEKYILCILLKKKMFKKPKYGIEILVCQAVFKL